MGAAAASKAMGKGRISKVIDTLSRIELERRIMSKSNKEDDDKGER